MRLCNPTHSYVPARTPNTRANRAYTHCVRSWELFDTLSSELLNSSLAHKHATHASKCIFFILKKCFFYFYILMFYPTFVPFVPARLSGLLRGTKKEKKKKTRILSQVEALFLLWKCFCLPPSHKFSTLDLFPFAHNVDKIA